ncbi:hypothetical protein Pan153_28580 [Gimesia panareensis]|uniref:Apolipoprotein N-acyltransferase n=1 Tax=Gimesia panareensis TaxID=2527978 RepID=A0A518FPB9_9PLAN|nr:hypothetical protein [Gimesia panareensis]QDV18201.1 hypothetical protein Pan153_28580 [Gimesia panareensis]
MQHDAKPISTRSGLILLMLAVVIPAVLWLQLQVRLPILIATLIVPLILMTVWRETGFCLGLIFFWGTLIAWGRMSVQPGQVDNMLPGLTMVLGWVPYLVFYGPVFLLLKSNARYRAKWETPTESDL